MASFFRAETRPLRSGMRLRLKPSFLSKNCFPDLFSVPSGKVLFMVSRWSPSPAPLALLTPWFESMICSPLERIKAMAQNPRPLLGISMGDPGGIGPEICAKALSLPELFDMCRPLVVGDAVVMADAVRFSKLNLGIHRVTTPEDGLYSHGLLDVLDLANMPMEKLHHKHVTPDQGRASFEYVARVIELALSGRIHGTVTCPINKAALNAAGYHFAGHTEIYAELTKTKDYAMMLAEENFRVVHVSTHVSLREACERVVKS